MFAVALDTSNELAQALLIHYSFDLSGYSASELIARWQNQYPLSWLHLAIIEALYQGRYKAISVQQILALWQRRGQTSFHFNVEFENLICSRFPKNLTPLPITSRLNKPKKNIQLQQQNYLSPVPVVNVNNNPDSLTTNDTQINSEKEHTSQKQIEEIPSFLHLARRHRQPILENTDNNIDTSPKNPTYTKSHSTFTETSSGDFTDKTLLTETIHQSASAVATATSTALETFNAVETVSTSLAKQQLSHVETSLLNHPPIGQFTPENREGSDSFTSKLKAISTHKAVDEEN